MSRRKFLIYRKSNLLFKISIVTLLLLLVWILNVLYLPHLLQWGMQTDDWNWLFYYDSYNGNQLSNFFTIKHNLGSAYLLQQVYYIGILKQIFGLNQIDFQLTTLLFKSLAALSVSYLIYKLTKDKIYAFFVIVFFTIFPSTAGLFQIIYGLNYLIIVFACFSIYFYIQSLKKEKKIFLASFFFFLALCAGPARAYLLLPIPFFVELVRLRTRFNLYSFVIFQKFAKYPLSRIPFGILKVLKKVQNDKFLLIPTWLLIFLRRLMIFYFLPLVFIKPETNSPYQLGAIDQSLTRIRQLTSGNFYTLSIPFQAVSTLFVDQHILKEILAKGSSVFPVFNQMLNKFLFLNVILLILSSILGLIVLGKGKLLSFILTIMSLTFIVEIIFYFFGFFSLHNGGVPFIDYNSDPNAPEMIESLDPTVFQASLGGYFLILGLILIRQWKKQRENKILKVMVFAWIWSLVSELFLYLSRSWYQMITLSNDRYILVSSVGAVVFTAGIFALSFRALKETRKLKYKLLFLSLIIGIIFVITVQNYKVLDYLYNSYVAHDGGGTSLLQETMYKRFLNKVGKENLKKMTLLYLDNIKSADSSSFGRQIEFRIYYGENGNLIRDGCRMVLFDFKRLKVSYTVYNGEKGFIEDYSVCVGPKTEPAGGRYNVFYPVSNFYAYRIENNDFIDVKEEIMAQLEVK